MSRTALLRGLTAFAVLIGGGIATAIPAAATPTSAGPCPAGSAAPTHPSAAAVKSLQHAGYATSYLKQLAKCGVDLTEALPVDVAVTRSAQPTQQAHTVGPATIYCRTDSYTFALKDLVRITIAKATLANHYCWTPSTYVITYSWPADVVTQHLDHSANAFAELLGLSYEGVDDSGQIGPDLGTWGGIYNKALLHTQRRIQYKSCALKWFACIQSYVTMTLWQYGNGQKPTFGYRVSH